MIILSLFSIYQSPAQEPGINLGTLGFFSIPLAILSFILNLWVVYYLFKGIKDLAIKREESDIAFDFFSSPFNKYSEIYKQM
jgi:hypothetical protein